MWYIYLSGSVHVVFVEATKSIQSYKNNIVRHAYHRGHRHTCRKGQREAEKCRAVVSTHHGRSRSLGEKAALRREIHSIVVLAGSAHRRDDTTVIASVHRRRHKFALANSVSPAAIPIVVYFLPSSIVRPPVFEL